MLFRRNKEAAFSNYRLWESAGFVIAYAYSTTLCARMKLYVLFGNLCIGVICYIIVEIRHRRKVRTGWCTLNVATDGNNFFFSDFIGTTTQETGGQRCGRSSSRIGRPSNRRDRRRTRRSGR